MCSNLSILYSAYPNSSGKIAKTSSSFFPPKKTRVQRKVLRQGAGWEILVREAQADEAGVCVFAKVLVILRTD